MAANRTAVCKDLAAVAALPLLIIAFGVAHLHFRVQGEQILREEEQLVRERLGALTQQFNLLRARRDELRQTLPADSVILRGCQAELNAVATRILRLTQQIDDQAGKLVLADASQYRQR